MNERKTGVMGLLVVGYIKLKAIWNVVLHYPENGSSQDGGVTEYIQT